MLISLVYHSRKYYGYLKAVKAAALYNVRN